MSHKQYEGGRPTVTKKRQQRESSTRGKMRITANQNISMRKGGDSRRTVRRAVRRSIGRAVRRSARQAVRRTVRRSIGRAVRQKVRQKARQAVRRSIGRVGRRISGIVRKLSDNRTRNRTRRVHWKFHGGDAEATLAAPNGTNTVLLNTLRATIAQNAQ